MSDPRPRIVVVTDVQTSNQSISGFSARYHAFLHAVTEVGDIVVVEVQGNDMAVAPIATAPWATVEGPSPRRRGSRTSNLLHRLVGRDPSMCQVSADELANAVLAQHPDVLVVALPYLAHVLRLLPPALPAVVLLEEGWERIVDHAGGGGLLRHALGVLDRRRVRRLYRQLRGRAALVVISEDEREWFRRYGLDVTVLPHAIDTTHFVPAQRATATGDIGVFGDLSRDRNWRPAVAVHAATPPSCRWIFAGRSGAEIRGAARPADVVTGVVEDIRPWYAAVRSVVVPSDEGTGVKTTVLQAWSCGRPLVVHEHSTRGLAVVDRENALVARSAQEAAELLQELLADPALAERLAEGGRAAVVANHDISTVARRFAELVRGLAAG